MRKTAAISKMNLLLFLIFTLFSLGTFNANSQTVKYDSIKNQKYIAVDVHKTYERIIQKGYQSIEMLEYLGNYYYKDNDFEKSRLYFDMLFKKYKLAQISPKSINQYNKLLNNNNNTR